MTEVFVEMAEEKFLAGKALDAYHQAKLAKTLDPFFPGLDKYLAAYRVHVAAERRNSRGEIDWYNVLGVDDYWVSEDVITHRFCKMGKLINPDHNVSAAAEGAYRLACAAFEVLGEAENREAFHRRWRLKPVSATRRRQPIIRTCASHDYSSLGSSQQHKPSFVV